MRVEYTTTFADLVLFSAVHQFFSLPMQAVFLAVAGLVFASENTVNAGISAAATATVLYAAMWLCQFVFNAVFQFSRRNRSILTRHSLEITDEGLLEQTPFNRSLYFWPGVARVVSRPGFSAVYVSAHQAHIIPNRSFSSVTERESFLRTLRERVGVKSTAV